ncbi:hypothetical protein [Aequorivita sp. KMM 9714]|uniref:hypothetical protein n=1 Tax=Aequorivita sp. KMM 9714 TaxID=2707173 RepID=UPI0013EE2E70|nr:hypothetical protein [Aequorivita sp. KMM 9714]
MFTGVVLKLIKTLKTHRTFVFSSNQNHFDGNKLLFQMKYFYKLDFYSGIVSSELKTQGYTRYRIVQSIAPLVGANEYVRDLIIQHHSLIPDALKSQRAK